MTIINTIENRILEMGGGEFQKLCDAYLSAIGYGAPNAVGSVPGANKVIKGTPDTFFINHTNGKFVFAEYTTQKENLVRKLEGDIKKCLDVNKTGVSLKNVEEIIICYTGQLTPAEVLSLKKNCRRKKLNLISISALANGLLSYHHIVRKYLNLPLDTGQIIPLEEFPSIYGKSKFATKLAMKFHFREKELEDFSIGLETNNLIVISGKPGVGKTRFALEGCRNFVANHPEYQAYAIVNISQNLYDDLNERFSGVGQFLIFVDDANRVISFSYFMYLLRNQRENQQIKIVVTVRDYALDIVKNEILSYPFHSMHLGRFTDEQITNIAKDEFQIFNSDFLERIVDLSKGNPRIAVMISTVAVEKNSLESINDVSSLYDEYFKSIKDDIVNLEDSDLLKTAGIISFLRVVDRGNEQMMTSLQKSFRISSETFWRCAMQLHKIEMVDMYENEVVRISDQVLSTYLFYLAFFRDKILDFSDILLNYFPDYRAKISDSLYPTLIAFDRNLIFDLIRSKVQKLWTDYESTNSQEQCLVLADSFYFLLPNETVKLIQKRLATVQFAPVDFSQLQLDSNRRNNVTLTTELQILGKFRYISPDLIKIVIDILFDYLSSCPAALLQVLHILVDDYNFDRYIARTGTSLQEIIVDKLWERTENGNVELFSRLFIALGEEYIKTHFETHEYKNPGAITFYNFNLPADPDIYNLRAKIFNRLFKLFQQPAYKQVVFALLTRYPNNYLISQEEIIKHDSKEILAFINSNLTSNNIEHNIFVNSYLDSLDNHKINFEITFRDKFQSEAYKVYCLLSENRKEYRQYDFEEYQLIRKGHFKSYFANFTIEEIYHYIDVCMGIYSDIKNLNFKREILLGFGIGFDVLAETNQDLFVSSLERYLNLGDKMEINPLPLVRIYMNIYGKVKTFTFLNDLVFFNKNRWLFAYYSLISPEMITSEDLLALYKLFDESENSQLPDHLDFLLNYISIDSRCIAHICQNILEKRDRNYSVWKLNSIINPYTELHKHLKDLFIDDIAILKKVYFAVQSSRPNNDYNSSTLSVLLNLEPDFIVEYIDWLYSNSSDIHPWNQDRQDYSILWENQNYREIFKQIINLIYAKEVHAHWYTELKTFFFPNEENRVDNNIRQRQEEFLTELIVSHYKEIDFIEFLFEVICDFPQEKRSQFIFTFLKYNQNFADFQRLHLEPSNRSWSGSAVPLYQARIEYFMTLLPMLDTAKLLEHRIYIQKIIDSLENQKNAEKKRDFIGLEDF